MTEGRTSTTIGRKTLLRSPEFLEGGKTSRKSPVPLLIHRVIPVGFQDKVDEADRQKAVLPAECRNIAVTHYQMGVALGFEKKYAEAIASLEAAASTLNKTMANLKGKSGKLAKMEVIEIEALIPEIKAKIADTV